MFVLNYVRKHKSQIAILIIFSMIATITSIVVPYLNGMFIDVLITTTSVDAIVDFALVIIAIGLFGAFASYTSSMAVAKLTSRTNFDMMSDSIEHVQKMPYEVFTSKFNPAYLIQRLSTDINALVSFFVSNFISVFLQAATFAVVMYLIASINMQVFFLAILFLPVYLISYMFLKKPLFKRSMELKEDQNHFSKVLFEQINRVQEIKAEAAFDKSREAENRSFLAYFRSLMNFSRLSYLFSSLDGLIAVLFQSSVLIIGGIQIINGDMTIGQFTIVSTYFMMLIGAVKYYFNLGKSYQDYKSSNARMNELLTIEQERNGIRRLDGISSITVDNASFSYVANGPSVIGDMTAEFRKGRIALITGPNGSGKTTLINILLGILQNLRQGSVRYNGVDVGDIDLYSTRREDIATLLQRVDLPDASVEEYINDALGLDRTGIMSMARVMGLEDMFFGKNFDLSRYWDTKLNTMSGGEKQKVMLLKVLGKGKSVMVLDEPSTGLDDYSIETLLKYLSAVKQDRTVIIISHDQRFREIADDVIMVGRDTKAMTRPADGIGEHSDMANGLVS